MEAFQGLLMIHLEEEIYYNMLLQFNNVKRKWNCWLINTNKGEHFIEVLTMLKQT